MEISSEYIKEMEKSIFMMPITKEYGFTWCGNKIIRCHMSHVIFRAHQQISSPISRPEYCILFTWYITIKKDSPPNHITASPIDMSIKRFQSTRFSALCHHQSQITTKPTTQFHFVFHLWRIPVSNNFHIAQHFSIRWTKCTGDYTVQMAISVTTFYCMRTRIQYETSMLTNDDFLIKWLVKNWIKTFQLYFFFSNSVREPNTFCRIFMYKVVAL